MRGLIWPSFSCSNSLGCIAPVGMESEKIADTQITASTMRDVNSSPSLARLRLKVDGIKQGGWSAVDNDLSQWLQVNLGSYTTITRVATQGRNGFSEWVTKYILQYSNDGVTFQVYREPGTRGPKVLEIILVTLFLIENNSCARRRYEMSFPVYKNRGG